MKEQSQPPTDKSLTSDEIDIDLPGLTARASACVLVVLLLISVGAWKHLIVIWAYGYSTYSHGLRIELFGSTRHGYYLTNGERLPFAWGLLLSCGVLGTTYALWQAASHIARRFNNRKPTSPTAHPVPVLRRSLLIPFVVLAMLFGVVCIIAYTCG